VIEIFGCGGGQSVSQVCWHTLSPLQPCLRDGRIHALIDAQCAKAWCSHSAPSLLVSVWWTRCV